VAAGVVGLVSGGESPLTKSVQENFRGFTYHGGESVSGGGLHGVMASRGKDKDEEKEREKKEKEPLRRKNMKILKGVRGGIRSIRRDGRPGRRVRGVEN
jgi:hypothetical protein